MENKLPIDKLLDIEESQYKIAVSAFKRVYQIADNDKLRKKIADTKRIPIIALAGILNGTVKVEANEEIEIKPKEIETAN